MQPQPHNMGMRQHIKTFLSLVNILFYVETIFTGGLQIQKTRLQQLFSCD